jgi:hypothetical protein
MRLVSFQTQSDQLVIVNPNQVRCVLSVGTGSKIEFSSDHSISVTTGAETTKDMLADEDGL